MFKRGLLLSTFLLFGPASQLHAYDEEATQEQQQTDRQQGKVVKEGIRTGEEIVGKGEKMTRQRVSPTELSGRAKQLHDRWQQLGYSPKVYEVTRNSVPAWMVTGNTDKGFRYSFFTIKRN